MHGCVRSEFFVRLWCGRVRDAAKALLAFGEYAGRAQMLEWVWQVRRLRMSGLACCFRLTIALCVPLISVRAARGRFGAHVVGGCVFGGQAEGACTTGS